MLVSKFMKDKQRFLSLSQLSNLLQILILLVACLCVTGCIPENKNSLPEEEISIVEGEINGVEYFIPEDYFVPPFKRISDDTIYVRAIYPDFAPITVDMQTLYEQGQQHRKIDILAKYWPELPSPSELIQKSITRRNATEFVGKEYGLLRYKQPENYNQDEHDLWLEKQESQPSFYINCSERLSKTSVPQCSSHIYRDGFHVKINFNKRLLSEWKTIRKKTLALLDSFQSEQSSKEFIKETSYTDRQKP